MLSRQVEGFLCGGRHAAHSEAGILERTLGFHCDEEVILCDQYGATVAGFLCWTTSREV